MSHLKTCKPAEVRSSLTFCSRRSPAACSSRLVLLGDVEPLEDIGQRHLQQLDFILLHLHPLLQVGEPVGHIQAAVRRAAVVWRRRTFKKVNIKACRTKAQTVLRRGEAADRLSCLSTILHNDSAELLGHRTEEGEHQTKTRRTTVKRSLFFTPHDL